MMNKTKLQKLIAKPLVLAIISAVIVIAGLLVAAFAGFNLPATADVSKALTVEMDSFIYKPKIEDVENACEKAFSEKGVSYNYERKGESSGYKMEIVYFCDVDATLTEVATAIEASLATIEGADFSVRVATVSPTDGISGKALFRMTIAGAVFAVLACAYVALRHKLAAGLTLFASMAFGAGLTCALLALTRIPVGTSTIAYAAFFAMLVTAVASTFTVLKASKTAKTEEGKTLPADELVASSLATKTILIFVASLAVALILVGAIATANVRWIAIASLVALVCAGVSALLLTPAFYIPLKKQADKKAAERARYDYKKTKKDVEESKN